MILAIETSCDECSAAVVAPSQDLTNSVDVFSNIIFSQIELHKPFGGVVPEVASRNHLEMVNVVIEEALQKAGITFKDLTAIAVTNRPGLIGALLVGVSAAKTLAYSLKIPLIAVNHLHGHLLSPFISKQKNSPAITKANLPMLICLVSGGHTCLYLLNSLPSEKIDLQCLAKSRDDAAGEAFDKSAKLMGLPYPGGRHIDENAQKGNPKAFTFPRPLQNELDFSFSGLKTAVSNKLTQLGFKPHIFGDQNFEELPSGKTLHDLCASVQVAIVDSLMNRIHKVIESHNPKSVAIVGGVSANSLFRSRLQSEIKLPVLIPDLQYCTDNAAMIGAAATFQMQRNEILSDNELLTLNAFSTSEISK